VGTAGSGVGVFALEVLVAPPGVAVDGCVASGGGVCAPGVVSAGFAAGSGSWRWQPASATASANRTRVRMEASGGCIAARLSRIPSPVRERDALNARIP
jgi:hypothetical protein